MPDFEERTIILLVLRGLRVGCSNWKVKEAHIDQVKEDASIMFLIKRQKNECTSFPKVI